MEKKTAKKYIEAIGRRKTATARVRIEKSTKSSFIVNDLELKDYFKTSELIGIAHSAFVESKVADKFATTVVVNGSGIHSQAEAIRHGISRALTEYDIELRGKLKAAGYMKRDPRAKERRKFGLKKARKAPQWSKR